jgi:hypothetical protein
MVLDLDVDLDRDGDVNRDLHYATFAEVPDG